MDTDDTDRSPRTVGVIGHVHPSRHGLVAAAHLATQRGTGLTVDPITLLPSKQQERTMTPASPGHFTDNTDPGNKADVERRYAELMGHKKPKSLRTTADERALQAAQEKRQRKARKRAQQQGATHA
jgi:hypothetical protein